MAAFLYRFGGFVRWPPETASAPRFTIDVLGDAQVAADLKRMLPGLTVQGRPAAIERIRNLAELHGARILYIGAGDPRVLERRIRALGHRPVLIVTHQPGALAAGSMINFIVIDGHVRFEVSLPAARRSGLTLSSELLSVALHVEGGPLGRLDCRSAVAPEALAGGCEPRLAER